ncbi:MAG: hypothetical protein ABJQ70_19780 [Roseobacter sp.]
MDHSLDGMSNIAALLFGMFIIVAFSYERFNRISYETSRRLERLVSFLTPDKLRARRQVTYAYMIYTCSLLLLYLILCMYSEVLLPLIGGQSLLPDIGAAALPNASQAGPAQSALTSTSSVATGFSPLGKSPVEFWTEGMKSSEVVITSPTSTDISIEAGVSMGLALVFVGLAPAIKPIARVDDWLRMFAHRVAGIPTWALEASDALRSNARELRFSSGQSGDKDGTTEDYLIYTSDIELVKSLRERGQPYLGRLIEDFSLDIEVILVASTWFLDEKLRVPGSGDKQRFEEIEKELRRRKTELLRTAKTEKLSHEDWSLLAADADALAADFCVLIALYNEQDIIQPFSDQSAPTNAQRRARERLRKFIDVLYRNKTEPMMQRRGSNLALAWTLSLVIGWTALWVLLWPGAAEHNLVRGITNSDPYERLYIYMVTTFNTYCLAVIVAITVRWVRMSNVGEDGQRRWENLRYPSHWTRWVPQVFMVLLLAWALSTTLIVAIQMWQSGFLKKPANEQTFEALLISIRARFEYNAPIALRGAILALLVLILLDARELLWRDAGRFGRWEFGTGDYAERLKKNEARWDSLSWRDSLKWAYLGALVMFVTTILTRYLSFLATANDRKFDDIDSGLLIWAVLYAVPLSALVMFCLAEVLTKRAFHKPADDHDEALYSPTQGQTQ